MKHVFERIYKFPEINTNKIVIWGRSMGAVTAVLF